MSTEDWHKYDLDLVVDAMVASGTVTGAAEIMGCNRSTIKRYIKKYPEVKAGIKEARSKLLDMAETNLMANVKSKHASSIFFVLKTLGKERGYVERVENTGKDGGPLEHSLVGAKDILAAKFSNIAEESEE